LLVFVTPAGVPTPILILAVTKGITTTVIIEVRIEIGPKTGTQIPTGIEIKRK
jgi:hypothetical protein